MPKTPAVSKGEGLVRTYDLLEHLSADVGAAFETLDANRSSQYLRRCVARTVFAFIEGLVQIVKHEVRSELRRRHLKRTLSKREQELLTEQRIKDGKRSPVYIPIDRNLKGTFHLAAKVWDLPDFTLETEGPDFEDFLHAKKARNRLTHPRTYRDLEVTDAHMRRYSRAYLWSRRSFTELFRKRVESLASDLPPKVRDSLLARPDGALQPPSAFGS